MAKGQPLFVRVLNVLKGGCQTPWTPRSIARQLDADEESCARACRRLIKGRCVVAIGKSFQWVPGAADPQDKRGKHGKHKKGAAWVAARKQRAALQRARARRLAAKISADEFRAGLVPVMWV